MFRTSRRNGFMLLGIGMTALLIAATAVFLAMHGAQGSESASAPETGSPITSAKNASSLPPD